MIWSVCCLLLGCGGCRGRSEGGLWREGLAGREDGVRIGGGGGSRAGIWVVDVYRLVIWRWRDVGYWYGVNVREDIGCKSPVMRKGEICCWI